MDIAMLIETDEGLVSFDLAGHFINIAPEGKPERWAQMAKEHWNDPDVVQLYRRNVHGFPPKE